MLLRNGTIYLYISGNEQIRRNSTRIRVIKNILFIIAVSLGVNKFEPPAHVFTVLDMRHQLSRISAVLRPAVVERRLVHARLHRLGAPAHSQAPTTPPATAVACGDRVPAAPVRSRHSLPRFLVREDAYVRASGPAPLRGGVLTRRPIVLRTAPLSATGRFLFRIGAGAQRQCSAGASGAPVLWSTPPAMPLSEDMRSAFRFSNACSLAKRCSLVSCWLFMSRSCMYIRVVGRAPYHIMHHTSRLGRATKRRTQRPML